jgi:Domain of unknown function (DUF4062)
MSKKIDLIRIFVAGPEDVGEEKKALEKVIQELNITLGASSNIRFELLSWESDAYPNIGEYPQAVINNEIGDDYDIFVGILWKSFGTPTKHARSGTDEEFKRAYERFGKNPDRMRVMFYFKTQGAPLDKLIPEQLRMIDDFRNQLGDMGSLWWKFNNTEDFEQFVRIHLSKQISDFGKTWGAGEGRETTEVESVEIQKNAVPANSNIDDIEYGLLDFEDVGVQEFATSAEATMHIVNLTKDIALKMTNFVDETKQLVQPLSKDQIRKMLDKTAEELENYAGRVEAEVPIMTSSYRKGVDAFGKSGQLMLDFGVNKISDVQTRLGTVQSLRTSIVTATDGIRSFRDAIAKLPRMTVNLNHAKRHVYNVLDNILNEYSSAESLTAEVEKSLIDVLHKLNDQKVSP